MSDKTVDQIYDIHKKLRDAGESIGNETQLYTELIAAAHSSDTAVKTLVATELPKYVHLFPTLAEQALTAQMDLLEDEQTAIRIRAIRGVELICRHSPQRTRAQGELIGQLLTAEASELSAVKLTLTALFSIDAKETFSALFTQLTQNDQPLRVNATEFIVQQMARLKADTISKSEDLQKHLGEEIKKVLLSDQILTSDEMKSWLQHLRELTAVTKDPNYGTDIGNILVKHAGLDKSFDPNAEQQINQYLTALTLAGNYSKAGLDNGPFLTYFATRIVPVFDTLTPAHKTDLLKAVSLATRFATPKTARALLPGIVDLLNGLIPRPGDKAATAAASDVKEEKDAAFQHKINFSFVECLLYAYHQLAKLAPDTVREVSGIFIPTGQPGDFSGDASKREAFIARLTHVSEQAKAFETQVSEHLKTQIKDKMKTASEDEKKVLSEKSKIAMISIRTAQSIQRLVQPLLSKEPQFISARLSWQSAPKGKGKAAGTSTSTSTSTKGQGTKRKAGNQATSQKGGQQGGQTGSKKKQKGQPQQQQQQQPAQNKKRKNDGGSGSNKKQRTSQDQSASSAPSYSGQPGETIVKREKPARGGSASQKRGGARGGGQQSRTGSQKKQQNSGNGGGFRNATPQRGGGGGRGRGGRGRGRGGRGRGRGRGRA